MHVRECVKRRRVLSPREDEPRGQFVARCSSCARDERAMIPFVGYHVARSGEHQFEERPHPERPEQAPRLAADLTSSLALRHSRARLWRYPPRTRGRRHRDLAQEEVFVVVAGTLTMLLGDPPERVELGRESAVAVEAGTALQLRNDSDEEAVVFAYGAPPEQAGADFLEDPEL
jgi:mannose-6-phosphate isomerase-like protein (cupin superfamily)